MLTCARVQRTVYVRGRERKKKRRTEKDRETTIYLLTMNKNRMNKSEIKFSEDFHRHCHRRRRHCRRLVSSRLLFPRNVVCATSSNPFISMGLSRVSEGPSTDDVIDVGRLMPYRACIRAERASIREYMLLYISSLVSHPSSALHG